MLTELQEAFRCLKRELGLIPLHQQKDGRMEGHLFVSVQACHLMATNLRELKQQGIRHRWETIRMLLAAKTPVTMSVTFEKGERFISGRLPTRSPFVTRFISPWVYGSGPWPPNAGGPKKV